VSAIGARALAFAGTLFFSAAGSSGRGIWPSLMVGAKRGEVSPSFSSQRVTFSRVGRSTLSSTIWRTIWTRLPYCTPYGQVLSQLRQVRRRSRCCWVLRVTGTPSSTCFIR
jgi:hypothetical protein